MQMIYESATQVAYFKFVSFFLIYIYKTRMNMTFLCFYLIRFMRMAKFMFDLLFIQYSCLEITSI